MKKTGILKLISVVSLSVILIALSVGTPTFSWFDRPQSLTGGKMEYKVTDSSYKTQYYDADGNAKTDTGLYGYTGQNVKITSNQYSSNGVDYTDEGAVASFVSNRTLAKGKRDYYKTTLTNSGTTNQNVSLYIADLKSSNSNGELCVGVNSPVKSYKNYSLMASTNNVNSATKVANTDTTIRVYFNPKNAWINNGWGSNTVEIQYHTANFSDTSTGTFRDTTYIGKSGDGQPIYYYDVPSNTKCLRFHVKGLGDNWSWTSIKSSITFTSRQSVCFWAKDKDGGGYVDNGYGQLDIDSSNVDGPYFIQQWNNSTNVYMRSTQDLSYTDTVDFKGSSVSYEATNSAGTAADTSKFTVNASTGVITPNAAGTGYLKVTVKGGTYGDTKSVVTTVKIANLVTGQVNVNDAPVITNVFIPAGQSVNVHWFIMNDKDANSSVTYTHGGVYVGL